MDFWCRWKFLCHWDITVTHEVTLVLTDSLSSLKSLLSWLLLKDFQSNEILRAAKFSLQHMLHSHFCYRGLNKLVSVIKVYIMLSKRNDKEILKDKVKAQKVHIMKSYLSSNICFTMSSFLSHFLRTPGL